MNSVIKLLNDPANMKDAIAYTASNLGISSPMIEKDLWVTFLLNRLFTESPWKDNLLFKGGTCLSKCYGVIDRFSEDIDLLLDWRLLGYGVDGPSIEASRKKQEASNERLIGDAKRFIEEEFVPTLRDDVQKVIGQPFEICAKGLDVTFRYPALFDNAYVRNEVLLEIGPRGRWGNPSAGEVSSYVSQQMKAIDDTSRVSCIPLEQAYYEKIQILHSSASRGKVPERYSRHYYDVCMIHRRLGKIQFDYGSLESNLDYNRRFYPGAGYGYDTMKKGSYRLMPTESMMDPLRRDYEHMKDMIFGPIPSFEDILNEIAEVENELNGEPPY